MAPACVWVSSDEARFGPSSIYGGLELSPHPQLTLESSSKGCWNFSSKLSLVLTLHPTLPAGDKPRSSREFNPILCILKGCALGNPEDLEVEP